jgi:hypothetical protein
MHVITAPHPLPTLPGADCPRPWLFLAGAIDDGRAEPWQEDVIASVDDLRGTVCNPRRQAWDATWGRTLDDPRLAEQVGWELDALERADLIAFWFPATAAAPISLLELGLHARGGRAIVGCMPGYHRQGNVAAVCRRYGPPMHDDVDGLIVALRQRITAFRA